MKRSDEKNENGDFLDRDYKMVIDLMKKYYLKYHPVFWETEIVQHAPQQSAVSNDCGPYSLLGGF